MLGWGGGGGIANKRRTKAPRSSNVAQDERRALLVAGIECM